MTNEFPYDVFLSHSAKDKAVVRAFSLSASNGERAGVRCRSLLRQDEPPAKAKGRRQKAEILHSAFSLLPSLGAPIKDFLARFLYINWRPEDPEQKSADWRLPAARTMGPCVNPLNAAKANPRHH